MNKSDNIRNICDFHSDNNNFRTDVIFGLQKKQKEIPAKYLYDEYGSKLFQSICLLDEYYIPLVETSIMQSNIGEIVGLLGDNVVLIEYGCGDCTKTRILLSNLRYPMTYVPVDISRRQLKAVSKELLLDYPGIEIIPICADYSNNVSLPIPKKEGKRVVYFPGSSVGNFNPNSAKKFLKRIYKICGKGGALLIGVDLKKDPSVIYRAYNDHQKLTATFNLNLLERMNRDLASDFKIEDFEHRAFYNKSKGRVEMHLVSLKQQLVHLDKMSISFSKGESIWTESSYKYHIQEFEHIANTAGFTLNRVWTDEKQWFSVMYLV
jgi:dimethylhistidine N-methyltransferase